MSVSMTARLTIVTELIMIILVRHPIEDELVDDIRSLHMGRI